MRRALFIALVYCTVMTPVLIQMSKCGWILPPQLEPPTDWPYTAKSRQQYRPMENTKETVNYYVP